MPSLCRRSPKADGLIGWVPESSGRGTWSLITSCVFTLLFCTWVVIHSRVYRIRRLQKLHKVAVFLKAIIAPEFIAVEGLQEWRQSRRMVQQCAGLTDGKFTLRHAFYVGMLGLRYRTSGGQKIVWPNQLTWLMEHELLLWKDHPYWGLAEDDIRDKSNADGAAKLLALSQVIWFVAQSIIRAIKGLPLSQMETMTLSYIPLFAITCFFWWLKPKDVMTPSLINLPEMLPEQKTIFESMAVSEAFDSESKPGQDSLWTIWYLTPRVFEKEAEIITLVEAEQRKLKENSQISTSKRQRAPEDRRGCKLYPKGHLIEASSTRPSGVVVAYWDPAMYHSKLLWPVICMFGVSFGALHLLSWNATFPTKAEQWLWRAASIASIASMLIFMQFEKVVVRWSGPLTLISLSSPIIYLFSRLVMIGGVIASFRGSDPSVYDTVVISTYWTHFL